MNEDHLGVNASTELYRILWADGVRSAPLAMSELERMAAEGHIKPDTLIVTESTGEGMPASAIDFLAPYLAGGTALINAASSLPEPLLRMGIRNEAIEMLGSLSRASSPNDPSLPTIPSEPPLKQLYDSLKVFRNHPVFRSLFIVLILWSIGEATCRARYNAVPQEPTPAPTPIAPLLFTPDELAIVVIELPPSKVFHETGWEHANMVKLTIREALTRRLTPCPQCIRTLIEKRRREVSRAQQERFKALRQN